MTKQTGWRMLLVCLVLSLGTAGLAGAQVPIEPGPVTERIMERGELVCGVNGTLPGFGFRTEDGYAGFDVEICRAVAAAVLGDADAVGYLELSSSERSVVLNTGDVDLISSNTTWTLTRDTEWDVTFGPTTFYDGQGVMVLAENDAETLEDLDEQTVCTDAGTTTELNINDAMNNRGLSFEIITFQTLDEAYQSLYSGLCDAVTSDRSALTAERATYEDPSALRVLDVTLSKEPLGPLTSQSDPQFADVVRWTVWGMINAEELGINSENVDEFLESDNPRVQRLLGVGGTPAGDLLAVENDFMVDVLEQVGNYGEVYERTIGADSDLELNRGINELWTNGGLIYAPPFR